MDLTEWVRAGHAGERATGTKNGAKKVEERAVDTVLDGSDAEILSVNRL
jgi:hypothetical protein